MSKVSKVSKVQRSVHLMLHFTLTRKQDPEILELLRLRQQLTPNLEGALHRFAAENHGLRGANSHPDRFTLGCPKPPQCMLEVTV